MFSARPWVSSMTVKRKNIQHLPTKMGSKERIAKATRRGLIYVLATLIALLGFLLFKIGISHWPAWMLDLRTLFMAIITFLIIFVSLMSPIMIEVNSNPRTLSGPGKNPHTNLPDFFK